MALIQGLEHVGIAARDSRALKDWYVAHLGCRVVFDDGAERPMYFIKMPDGSMFEIYPDIEDAPPADNKRRGIRHIAISCKVQDFEQAAAYFAALNVQVVSPASFNPNGASNFFFRDPEGNIVQLVARAQPL